ncbi:MAG: hypothetical protein DI586_01620 [Micavibrio aeruginosavorus]|uniref:Uncharacterized protein n=1 Tax=Micavibrio aeruginosavorus TaxID=349221 RepID=A0A2W5FMB2_9BACT|nr:MAG: hypothetical protein DI586_01620 [Micavibrio aeruginosavorus]
MTLNLKRILGGVATGGLLLTVYNWAGENEQDSLVAQKLRENLVAAFLKCTDEKINDNQTSFVNQTDKEIASSLGFMSQTYIGRHTYSDSDLPLYKNGQVTVVTMEYDLVRGKIYSEETKLDVESMRYDHKLDKHMNQYARDEHKATLFAVGICLNEKGPMI